MKRGFTLIELATIVAIGYILAAILLPVLQRPHRGYDARASCQANLKYLGMGLLQYTQDYDEVFPCAVTGRPVAGWADAIDE